MLASVPAKSSPSLSSPGGPDSSERDFYRYASGHLREAFPTLPDRSQFNRLVRSYTELIEEMALYLAGELETRECSYEALDS